MKHFIKKHSVFFYYALTFCISFGGILYIVGGPGGIPGSAEQIENLSLPVMMALFAGPSIAGVLMTGLTYGKAGFRSLGLRITMWRVKARWYAIALLTAPILFIGVSFALSINSEEYIPSFIVTGDKVSLLIFGISYGLIGGGLLEELGWTGFAVPALRVRHNIFRTALIVGVLWGAWHFLVIYWMSDPNGEVPLALLLPIQLFSWLPAYRVLMVWVYERTGGSLLIAMLMHASLSASMLIFQPQGMTGYSLLTFILTFAAALWIVTIAISVANRKQLFPTA